jgi:prepilin-type N-terminal cleavage/methylation domain-containing protein
MKKNSYAGFTLLELLLVVAIIVLLAVLFAFHVNRSINSRLADNEARRAFGHLQSALTYGMLSNNHPIEIKDGWYYFGEDGLDINQQIQSFLCSNTNNFKMVLACESTTENRTNGKLRALDDLVAKLADRSSLTNGWFVRFELIKTVAGASTNTTASPDYSPILETTYTGRPNTTASPDYNPILETPYAGRPLDTNAFPSK